jgi:U32 family peptidase
VRRPEILSPAGGLEKLKIAFEYGADAVYASGKDFGLRSFAENFTDAELEQAVGITRAKGKKIYITVNIFPDNGDIPAVERHMAFLNKLKVDAIIISDLGVFSIAREIAPDIPVHISVQANNLNYREVKAWKKLGASRVILARELSIEEITEIRRKVQDIELEIFVHGAICVSMSGRCLLSDYMTGRGANKGECAQSCRWSYMLVEEKRKGEYLPVMEDGRGTYILNSKDLCTIGHIPELVKAGIDSFKIEGRMKSAYYAAITTAVYKKALDSYISSPEKYKFDASLYSELEKVSHRQYFPGFYFEKEKPGQDPASSKYVSTHRFIGYVKETSGNGIIRSDIMNTVKLGDQVEIFTPEAKNIKTKISGIIGSDGIEETYAKQDKEYSLKVETKETIKAYSMIRQEEKAE